MPDKIKIWFSNRYLKIINSIAFYPALIALSFLALSIFMVRFDFSDLGKNFKAQLTWFSLKDATTARSIISSIVSGLISLTVFSFSMVMIILNQTASQMSNRILDRLIGNRFQQIVLGVYIGTIVFALFLLSTIRDINSGISIPAISTYFLIILTIIDIFLFIYFLHYITQSVKYQVIIQRIYADTKKVMLEVCTVPEMPIDSFLNFNGTEVKAMHAGIFEGFNKKALSHICGKYNCQVRILLRRGSFIFKDTIVAILSKNVDEEQTADIAGTFYINNDESLEKNFTYGFRQLTEVAVKALSPGINDPGTAIASLHALSKLFAFRLDQFPNNHFQNIQGQTCIISREWSIDELFSVCILPIWDYGKNDRMVRNEFLHICTLFTSIERSPLIAGFYEEVKKMVNGK
ncbi:MAG: DUF2254 domain-containing protein [Bacteroidota bacterium]